MLGWEAVHLVYDADTPLAITNKTPGLLRGELGTFRVDLGYEPRISREQNYWQLTQPAIFREASRSNNAFRVDGCVFLNFSLPLVYGDVGVAYYDR